MPLIRKFVIAVLATMSILMIISLFLETKWEIKKSVVMYAPAKEIFPYINETRNWAKWSPWDREADITIAYSFEGPEAGEGAVIKWQGSNTDPGTRVITKSVLNEGVEYNLYLSKGFSARGEVTLETVKEGSKTATKVTWRDYGDLGWNLMGRLIVADANDRIGLLFEKGLMKLKALVETE